MVKHKSTRKESSSAAVDQILPGCGREFAWRAINGANSPRGVPKNINTKTDEIKWAAACAIGGLHQIIAMAARGQHSRKPA